MASPTRCLMFRALPKAGARPSCPAPIATALKSPASIGASSGPARSRTIGSGCSTIGPTAGDAVGPGIDQPDRGIARQLLPRLGQDVQRWLVIVAEQAMRVAGEAIARQAGIENGDLAAGTAELQGAGETGKAAADDDDVIHGDGLRVVDGGGWAGLGAQLLVSRC